MIPLALVALFLLLLYTLARTVAAAAWLVWLLLRAPVGALLVVALAFALWAAPGGADNKAAAGDPAAATGYTPDPEQSTVIERCFNEGCAAPR